MTRSVDEIARGLEPARAPLPIEPGERIHVIGAAGAAAAASLLLADAAGARVSGCDAGEPSPYTPPLEDAGIPLAWEHDPTHVVDTDGAAIVDRIAVTKALTSVDPDQPSSSAAHLAGVPPTSVQQLIADAVATAAATSWRWPAPTGSRRRRAGCSTCWSPPAWIHRRSWARSCRRSFGVRGVDASAWGGDATVVEADEYAGNFDPYRPVIGVAHERRLGSPRRLPGRADVVAAFEAGSAASTVRRRGTGDGPILVANAGDPGVAEVSPRLADWPGRLVAFEVIVGDATAAERRIAEAFGAVYRRRSDRPPGWWPATRPIRTGRPGSSVTGSTDTMPRSPTSA